MDLKILMREINIDILGEIILYLEPAELLWIMFNNSIKERLYNESIKDSTSKLFNIWKKKIENDLTTIDPTPKKYLSFIKNPLVCDKQSLKYVIYGNYDSLLKKWIQQGFQLDQYIVDFRHCYGNSNDRMIRLIIDNVSIGNAKMLNIDKYKVMKRLLETDRIPIQEIIEYLNKNKEDQYNVKFLSLIIKYEKFKGKANSTRNSTKFENFEFVPKSEFGTNSNLKDSEYLDIDFILDKHIQIYFTDMYPYIDSIDRSLLFPKIQVGLHLIDNKKVLLKQMSILYRYALRIYATDQEVKIFYEIRKRNIPFDLLLIKDIIKLQINPKIFDLLIENNIIDNLDQKNIFSDVDKNTELFFEAYDEYIQKHHLFIKYQVKLNQTEIFKYLNLDSKYNISWKSLDKDTFIYLITQAFPDIKFKNYITDKNTLKDENMILDIDHINRDDYNLLQEIFENLMLYAKLYNSIKKEIAKFFVESGFHFLKEKPYTKIFNKGKYDSSDSDIIYRLQCFANYDEPSFWIKIVPKCIKYYDRSVLQKLLSYRKTPFTNEELKLYSSLTTDNADLSLVIQRFNPSIVIRSLEQFIDTLI